MKKFFYLFLLSILFNACGNDNNNKTSSKIDKDKYISISMNIYQKYEVNPNDIYIPIEKNTKLKIEYQPLIDKQFISILNGKATLKKKKN